MQSPSKLRPDDASPLYLDASVLINLAATDCADRILSALERPIIVSETATAEFKHHPRDGSDTKGFINTLVEQKIIRVTRMTDLQFETFLRLTGCPPPDDLGDGEAATLACADGNGFAVIDDRKAQRIASRDFPNRLTYCSLDLLCAGQAFACLKQEAIASAVYDAIRIARMRVPFSWTDWIISLLGPSRTAELPVLSRTRAEPL